MPNNYANTPTGIPYQAEVRNESGEVLANTNVNIRFTLHELAANGTVSYQETHALTTNELGLFAATIGAGTAVQGTFAGINWAQTTKFLQVEVNTGSGWISMSNQRFLSVPYTLYATNGAQGPQGPFGPQGNPGAPGPQGPSGPPGPAGNAFSNGSAANQILYWNGTSWVTLNPGANGQMLTICNGALVWTEGGICTPSISTIHCAQAINNTVLTAGMEASSICSVPYSGGNGGSYSNSILYSSGVLGLTASLNAGTLVSGAGILEYVITGIPQNSGTASFNISIGGQSCVFSISIQPNGDLANTSFHSCGANNIHNNSISYATMTDQEGNSYKTVVIGAQEWMAENLKTSIYRNGDAIANPTIDENWATTSSGAWVLPNNSPTFECPYGKLYNWFTCVDTRELCPSGWRVPGNSEWDTLTNFLGGPSYAGDLMRSTGNIASNNGLWIPNNSNASNSSGFSGLPAGYCLGGGLIFENIGYGSFFWAGSEHNSTGGYYRLLLAGNNDVEAGAFDKQAGFSVRCMRSATISSLVCSSAVYSGTLNATNSAQNVSVSIPYTGGNGANYASQSFASTGVSGLNAILDAGLLDTGTGTFTLRIIGTPSTTGTASFNINFGGQSCSLSIIIEAALPSISAFSCGDAILNGTLIQGLSSNGVSCLVPYLGGNSANYLSQSFYSTGVEGITATLSAGALNLGSGQLLLNFTGTPMNSGTAIFTINFGGISCELQCMVNQQATVSSLECTNVMKLGSIVAGSQVYNTSLLIPYTGGNGGAIYSQNFTSTGVLGLSATLAESNISLGAGTLLLTIQGIAQNAGNAIFSINIANEICTIIWTIPSATEHSCGLPGIHNPDVMNIGMIDQEGNVYKTVIIGTQEWMAENLKTSIYRNGDPIQTNLSNLDWSNTNQGAYSYYNNQTSYSCPFGKLYNWYTCVDSRQLCPVNWHMPSEADWTTLTNYLDNEAYAGGKMKTTGTLESSTGLWLEPNTGATNNSGFSAIPGGWRSNLGNYELKDESGFWWSSDELGSDWALPRAINYYDESCSNFYFINKEFGLSVRCMRMAAAISSINCSGILLSGELKAGVSAHQVNAFVPYFGGNGGRHAAMSFESFGVTGLTAFLAAGTIQSGEGSLYLNIIGTPNRLGTASFNLTFGGRTCTMTIVVSDDSVSATNYHSCGALEIHNSNLSYGTMFDQEGRPYKTIIIGTQEWMAENLDTKIYQNGDLIETNLSNVSWSNTTSGSWAYYSDNTHNSCPYGRLYNWNACIDSRGLCPVGWHIPSDAEWTTLTNYLGGIAVAGGKLKSTATLNNNNGYWMSPNTAASNSSGFSALPGAYRNLGGSFAGLGSSGSWWTSSSFNTLNAMFRKIDNGSAGIIRNNVSKKYGFSVRCLKN
jgi:uncharacterized protein (TIGR02145 family)